MRGERPTSNNSIFKGCGKLKSIHVPAKAKSWAGMKDWHGIPLVFDGASETNCKADGMSEGKLRELKSASGDVGAAQVL